MHKIVTRSWKNVSPVGNTIVDAIREMSIRHLTARFSEKMALSGERFLPTEKDLQELEEWRKEKATRDAAETEIKD